MTGTLLEVRNLWVRFPTPTGVVEAVRGISFDVAGEKLGIVGESGSGKSTVGRAVLRLVPRPGMVTADRLAFTGTDLLASTERQMRRLRGASLAMILQDPRYALNPVMRVGRQIEEAVRAHEQVGRRAARRRALEMLEQVRIRDPERVHAAYPHELSGGMGQRAMIAIMLAAGPKLLIADEPTSALDVTVQMQVLAILDDLVSARGMGLVFISHDLELVASFCDRILVMYAGRILESLPARTLHEAQHPYTRGLLACLPQLERPGARLATMRRDPAWLTEPVP
jgi:peptide/nickel transport system ATP-binding protein